MASSKRQMCCSGFFFAVHPILLAKDSKNVLSVAGMSTVYVNPFCIILQILYSVAKIMQIFCSFKKNIEKFLFYFALSSIGTILNDSSVLKVTKLWVINLVIDFLLSHRHRLIYPKKDNPVLDNSGEMRIFAAWIGFRHAPKGVPSINLNEFETEKNFFLIIHI